jgi:hypothetical protein
MSKGTTTPNDVLKMILSGTDPTYRTNANLYLALHKGDPSAGDQTTDEADYSGYGRKTLAKSGAWTDGGSTFSNAALIQFAACNGGTSATVTHISIGVATSGASQILYCGSLADSRTISNGIQPQFDIGALQVTET